jgi:hypothetical protein
MLTFALHAEPRLISSGVFKYVEPCQGGMGLFSVKAFLEARGFIRMKPFDAPQHKGMRSAGVFS